MAYTGKVALVTGAGSGMGQLACRNFAKTGARIAAVDINAEGLKATAEGYGNITTYQVDVTDYDAILAVVDAVESDLGPIDRVMNCAAIMPLGKLLDLDVAMQHKAMQINYGGLVNITNAALPKLIARGSGEYISFASMAGLVPTMMTGSYSVTKAAVTFYNEVLYHEYKDSGVQFASIHPPVVATPLLEQGAGVWPKMLEEDQPIQPQEVLDALERGLEKGEFMIFVRRQERFGAFMRRLMPSAIWKHIHKIEGW